MYDTTLETIYFEAIENFPYPNMQTTGCVQGDFDVNSAEDVEYSEEHTFHAGMVCEMPIEGGGWIDCYRQDRCVSITGLFGLSRDGDWQNGSILPEGKYLQGWYDLESKTWSFSIECI